MVEELLYAVLIELIALVGRIRTLGNNLTHNILINLKNLKILNKSNLNSNLEHNYFRNPTKKKFLSILSKKSSFRDGLWKSMIYTIY